MKYAWVEKHQKVWPVSLTCQVLEISTSGYFERLKKRRLKKPDKPSAPRVDTAVLLAQDVARAV